MNVRQFLHEQGVSFQTLDHRPTYAAQQLAQAVHVPGHEVAKAVLLGVDEEYALCVLPATRSVDISRVASILKAEVVELASESECGRCFPDCELGALPPFGSRYGLKTLMDLSLREDEQIVFEANNHHEAVRMNLRDYVELEQPIMAEFTHPF